MFSAFGGGAERRFGFFGGGAAHSTTPTSTAVHKFLMSITEQIAKVYNLPYNYYQSKIQLYEQLNELLHKIPKDEILIFLFDAINQLDKDGHDCEWLPFGFRGHAFRSIPFKNVKCIVSVIKRGENKILETFTKLIGYAGKNDENLIEVSSMNSVEVAIIYENWFKMKKRCLSDEQATYIRLFMEQQNTILPLYMKLIFDIIIQWHSYDDPCLPVELKGVDACILYIFKQLERRYNPVLVSHSLCYLTMTHNGISGNELEDLLSLDNSVLGSVFEFFLPPTGRIPGTLWTRIRNELDEYLTETEIDDTPLSYW
ncbi:unnamed protein product [Didymodactylos carnosus]|uniref:Uncharacterized protein n=1 Tax=Didymodactylos carnosus TaxID=1234261 RepID=A0A815A8P8_9BILA|nr:unnamed protein product [Didymodactylos carnosus]CAF4024396.1 unnamed protein product [Didymodactylos carnosus]